MQNNLRRTFLILISTLLTGSLFSQVSIPKTKEQIKPSYIMISFGAGSSNFRDFATSPLVYQGGAVYMGVGRLKHNVKSNVEYAMYYTSGKNKAEMANTPTVSHLNSFSSYYSRLYPVRKFYDSTWGLKAGGLVHATGNYRYNKSLRNNSVGFELIANIMASVQADRDVSRTKVKHKKFLFIKYTLNPRHKELSVRFNVGAVNTSYRDGYIYTRHASVLNQFKIFDGYQFKVFSGARVSSFVDYTIYLKNNNAFRFSYVWDAYKTGGDLDKLEMASHILKFTLLFKTN